VPLELTHDRPPIPPADLILRVAPSFDTENIEASRQAFDVQALNHLHHFERALAVTERTFTDFSRLLDFGCGCGRFIRHFASLSGEVEIHGTDIDQEMVTWLRDNVPYGHYEVAPFEPPLPYRDGQFDLVLNHSVFTHLDERLQDLWLEELRRVTCPDGLLLLTVEGEASWNRLWHSTGEPQHMVRWRRELDSRGILHIKDDVFIGSTHPDFYHSTFHRPWYVFEHWTRYFDLVAYLPNGSDTQDLVVLRRGQESSTPEAESTVPIKSRGRWLDVVHRARAMAGQRVARWAGLRPVALERELRMLRVGLYEQGNRMSVLAAELRREMDDMREGRGPRE